jgi:hypothetical protein
MSASGLATGAAINPPFVPTPQPPPDTKGTAAIVVVVVLCVVAIVVGTFLAFYWEPVKAFVQSKFD